MATKKKTTEEAEKKNTVAAAAEKKAEKAEKTAKAVKKVTKKKAEPKEAVKKEEPVAYPEKTDDVKSFFAASLNREFKSGEVGTLSEELFEQEESEKTPSEKEALLYQRLKRYERDGEICWGTVIGVENRGTHVDICVLFDNQKVIIPDQFYFEKSFDFGKNYFKMTEAEKIIKREKMAKYQLLARVCFQVVSVNRQLNDEGNYEIGILGNRCAAMAVLRDVFFFHKNRKSNSSVAPRTIKEGDLLKAKVIAVREETVIVELGGVETRLFSYNLLNNKIVDNCRNYTQPGRKLNVLVKKVYLNSDETVHLSVTGRTGEVSKLIKTIKKGGHYVGQVQGLNKEKGTYTIVLKGGILASVPESNVMGRCILTRGDSVSVFVTNIYDGHVAGSAMKL